jgi:uncharacterized protein
VFNKILLLLAVLLLPLPAFAAPGKAIPVLLISGASSGTYHNWKLTTPILKKELEETGRFAVTVMMAPPTGGDFSAFHPDFARYKVVVSNYDQPDWPADLRAAFERYMANGGGLVIVHAADNSFPNWPAYNKMIGVGGWRERTETAGPHWYVEGGKVLADTAPGPTGEHGARRPFLITVRDTHNPIMKGLPHAWMHATDELYASLRGPGGMKVLGTAFAEAANKGTDRDEPMLMTLRFGKGRIFHTVLGHDAAALSCVGFIATYQRGTEWAATGKVTQKVPKNFPTASIISMRADIAAMDPAYAAGTTVTATPLAREDVPLPPK